MADTSKSLFYNSQNGDRLYDADSFEHWLKRFFTSGVFTGDCQVTTDGQGMSCTMAAGYANLDGKVRFFDETVALTLQNAHATYGRIDTVVIERNDTDREITAKVVTGTSSMSPVAPEPVRENGVYQLVVAEISIPAGTVRLSQGLITDKRPDTTVCGYVMNAVQTPDFTELYAQFTDQFNIWFQSMKDQLSEDAAGHLQQEIDDLASDIDDRWEFDVSVQATSETTLVLQDNRITADFKVRQEETDHTRDISWTTSDAGELTLSCPDGIPEMTLTLYKPRNS